MTLWRGQIAVCLVLLLSSCGSTPDDSADDKGPLARTSNTEPVEPAPVVEPDVLSGLPGVQITSQKLGDIATETLFRIDETDVPELARWIADYSRGSGLKGKFLDPAELERPEPWTQADHRGILLQLMVVGGLFGDSDIPTSDDGASLNITVLPSLKAFGDEGDSDEQLLYQIESETSASLMAPEELVPIWRSLPEEESLVLLAITFATAEE